MTDFVYTLLNEIIHSNTGLHVSFSPEPNKEDSSLLNGDSKSSEVGIADDDSDNWENTSSEGSDTDRSVALHYVAF